MNDATLQGFRGIAEAMGIRDEGWQWIGPHMSQRMFGISEARAKEYAERHGGQAAKMVADPIEALRLCVSYIRNDHGRNPFDVKSEALGAADAVLKAAR